MVCPMKQGPSFLPPISYEYPIEVLYRPWSWSLSAFMNIFLFIFISWLVWSMVKRRRAKKAQSKLVPFRKVVTQGDSVDEEKRAKVLVVGGMGRAGKALLEKLVDNSELETHVLDLYIPEADDREADVSSYTQCDPAGSEDIYIALQKMETVYVMSRLTLPSDDKGSPTAIPISDTAISNIIDGCRSCGVKRLVVVTEITHTLSKMAAEHEAGKKLKLTEQSVPEGSTALEQMVLEAATGSELHSCVVRAGLLYHRHGDRLKVDNAAPVNTKLLPTKTIPMVTVDHLAEVLCASAACMSGGVHQGQVFLACGTTPEEQGFTWKEVSGAGPAVEVDDSESRRVLKM